MAKLLYFLAALLVASAIVAEAHITAPPPSPGNTTVPKNATFSLKCVIHNLATRNVTFKLVIQGKEAAKPVVTKAQQWSAIGPVTVGCKVPVVQVCVTVKTNRGVAVTKTFPVRLAVFLKEIVPKCSKTLVLTAYEVKSWWKGGKSLVVKVGRKVELVVKL